MTPRLLDVNPVTALDRNHEGHRKNVSPAPSLHRKTKEPAHSEKMGTRTPGLRHLSNLRDVLENGPARSKPRWPVHRLGTGLVKPADALSSYQSDARPSNQQIVIESELLAERFAGCVCLSATRGARARQPPVLQLEAYPQSQSFGGYPQNRPAPSGVRFRPKRTAICNSLRSFLLVWIFLGEPYLSSLRGQQHRARRREKIYQHSAMRPRG
jgi:hypothetical protein